MTSSHSPRPSPRWGRPRFSAVLALVVAVLVACGGGGGGAGGGSVVTGAVDERRLVPEEVPAVLQLCSVSDEPEDFPVEGGTHAAVWGDASLDDPWAGPLVMLSTSQADRLPVHDGAEAVGIRGGEGYVAPAALFQAVSSAEYGHVATWFEQPGLVAEALVRGGSGDDARRLAEAVVFDGETPTLPVDHLGADTRALSTGPFPHPLAVDQLSSWRSYWLNLDAGRSLTVRGLLDVPDALDLLRFLAVSSEAVTVDGRSAMVYSAFGVDTGPWGVAWAEPDGLVVQVSGLGFGRDEIVDIAASVTDVGPDRWQELMGQTEDCSPTLPSREPPGDR